MKKCFVVFLALLLLATGAALAEEDGSVQAILDKYINAD